MVYIYKDFMRITYDDYKEICALTESSPQFKKIFRRYTEKLRHNLCVYLLYMHFKRNEALNLLLTFDYDEYGKPLIFDNYVSFSRCVNCVAVGVDKEMIGVDVEDYIYDIKLDDIENNDFMTLNEKKMIMNSENYNFFINSKEAYVKCIGTGIDEHLYDLDYSLYFDKHRYKKGNFEYIFKPLKKYSYAICSKREQHVKIISYKELRRSLYE